LAILFLLLALLIGAAFYLMLAGRRTQQSTLSDDQRGELLEEIRGWLAEEPEQAVVENA
jgi:hypothetical protein